MLEFKLNDEVGCYDGKVTENLCYHIDRAKCIIALVATGVLDDDIDTCLMYKALYGTWQKNKLDLQIAYKNRFDWLVAQCQAHYKEFYNSLPKPEEL